VELVETIIKPEELILGPKDTHPGCEETCGPVKNRKIKKVETTPKV
jgi:hypothetical protein